MNIIFAGVIAREPLGGPAWVWLQYLLGFRRLGHNITFLEECGAWPYSYDFTTMTASGDGAQALQILRDFLTPFGFGERAVFRSDAGCIGITSHDFQELCRTTDVLIALPTSMWSWRPEYDSIPVRVFLDVDPGFSQFRVQNGDALVAQTFEHCNRFLTYGPGLAGPHSTVPTLGRRWRATRPPVVVDEWPVQDDTDAECFTTIMQWSSDPSPEIDGRIYGQKNVEFERVLDLPRHTDQPLEIALSGGPEELLRSHGWRVVPGWQASQNPDRYRRYVQSSRGEFSVAKHGYVATGIGWISDRTVCFLASGRPALVQETGMSRHLPTGEGLVTFRSMTEARDGIEEINARYSRHQLAARRLAETYFDSDLVLTQFLEDVAA